MKRPGHPAPTTPADMLRSRGIDPDGLTHSQKLDLIRQQWPEPDWTAEECPGHFHPCKLRGCRCNCHAAVIPAQRQPHHDQTNQERQLGDRAWTLPSIRR